MKQVVNLSDRREIEVPWPVRIVKWKGCPFYCATDMAKLFGYKKPYDAAKHFVSKPHKILVPCKQSPENSRTLCFFSELQARSFVGKQLRLKGFAKDDYDEWKVEQFFDALSKNKMPACLREKTVPKITVLKPVPGGADRKPREVETIDVMLSIMQLVEDFKKDLRELVAAS